MSQVLEAEQRSTPAAVSTSPTSRRNVLIWTVSASLFLVGSGVVRSVQVKQDESGKGYLVECPFLLNSIPQDIDGWHVLQGSDTVLDPLTTRITGSTDHIMRTYVDEMNTGVMLSVLILFGPAVPVMPHTPEVCYPSSGFQNAGNTIDRDIKINEHETAKFRSSVFAKAGGRTVIRQSVYHSFFLDQIWSPTIDQRKLARKNPGIFKVQIQRRVVDGEKRDQDEPIEDFVKKLLPLIEKMIQDAHSAKSLHKEVAKA